MAGGADRLGSSSSPLDRSSLEALARLDGARDASPAGEADAAPAAAQWNAARLANSKAAGDLAMMARLMEAEEKAKAKEVPTATSLDSIEDITKTDWSKWKPSAADKKLLEAWSKLTPDEARQAMSRLGYRQQHLIFDVVNHQSADGKVAGLVGAAMFEARTAAAGGTERGDEARWLATFSDKDLEAWYQHEVQGQSEEVRSEVTIRLARAFNDAAGSDPALVELQERINLLNLKGEAGKIQYTALNLMPEKELVAHLRKLAKDPQTLAWTMQAVAVHKTDARIEAALKKALVLEAKASGSSVLFDFADATTKLMGESGTQVRAAVIEVIHDQFQDAKKQGAITDKLMGPEIVRNQAADALKDLVMADPLAVTTELKRRNPDLLDGLMTDIAMGYPNDPDKAASALADVVGAVAQEVGIEAHGKLGTTAEDRRFRAHAETAGYMLGAAQNALDSLATFQNKRIEHGAFILRVFEKGVTMIAGGFMAGADKAALNKAGGKSKEVIGWLEEREKNQVKDWQKRLGTDLSELLNKSVAARIPTSAGHDERQRILDAVDSIAPYLTDGYDRARARKG